MDASLSITLLVILTVIAGIGGQVLAALLKVPSIVFLLLFGILLGRDGLGLIQPSGLGVGLDVLVALSVALILFEGGLNLELRELGRVSGSLRNLITIGVGITLLGGAMAAHWLSEFPWSLAFLYGAIVVVTGPTVTVPLLQQVKVDREVSALIEGEGVLIDPLGAILAVVVLDIILNEAQTPLAILSGLGLRLGIGLAIGLAGGGLLGLFLKRAKFLSEDLKNLLVLAGAWGIFGLAQSIRSEAGLMASVVSGIVLGASSVPGERLLRRFKGQLTVLAISVLFILLAADLSIASVFALGWGGLGTVFVLMFAVRPIEILSCTLQSNLNWRQKFFLSWVAPRGIVSASVASLFSILLTERGINGGDSIKALVFLTIILTVFLQGLSAKGVAQLLRLGADSGSGTVLVGSNALSRLIAQLLQDKGGAVTVIDTNEAELSKAQDANIPTFLTSAFDAEALDEAGMGDVATVLVTTSNSEVNQAIAQRIVEEFNPPNTLVVSPDAAGTSTSLDPKIELAFDPELSVKTWNQYLAEGSVELGETELRSEDFEAQNAHLLSMVRSGELIPLFLDRREQRRLFRSAEEWKPGDRLIYLLHSPKPKLLKRLGGGGQLKKLAMTKQPSVENIPELLPAAAAESPERSLEAIAKDSPAKALGQQLLEKLPVMKKSTESLEAQPEQGKAQAMALDASPPKTPEQANDRANERSNDRTPDRTKSSPAAAKVNGKSTAQASGKTAANTSGKSSSKASGKASGKANGAESAGSETVIEAPQGALKPPVVAEKPAAQPAKAKVTKKPALIPSRPPQPVAEPPEVEPPPSPSPAEPPPTPSSSSQPPSDQSAPPADEVAQDEA